MTPYPQANYSLWKFIRTNEKGWKLFYVAVLILYFVVVRGIRGDGLWYIDVFLGLLTVAAVIRDYLIRAKLQRLNATPGNLHRSDVCETCNPVRWNDGRPLTELYQWYAAMQDISWHDAQLNIGNMTTNEIHVLRVTHDKYLSHQQFDKFRS